MSNSSSVVLTLNDQEYTVNRATLRLWLQLEEYKDSLSKAAEIGNTEGIIDAIYSYISAVLIDIELDKVPWYEVMETFFRLVNLNLPSFEFPFLKSVIDDHHKVTWDYEGRTWYIWLNILSSRGWNIEYISNLDIDDAIGLAQEMAVDRQLDLEKEWALSEKSVSYDKKGKGTFKPLERPVWMKQLPREIKVSKIPKSMLPQGIVLGWSRDEPTEPS